VHGPLRPGTGDRRVPEGTWYTFVDREDLDEIVERHLRKARWWSGCGFLDMDI